MKFDDENYQPRQVSGSNAKLSETEPLSVWKKKLKRGVLSKSGSLELKSSINDEKAKPTKATKLKRKPVSNDVNSLSKEQTKKKKTKHEKKETKVEKLHIVTKQEAKVSNLKFLGTLIRI